MREIGGRHALVDASLEELRDLRALGLREPRVEKRLEPVERQVQRVQQQVGRLVVGVVGAVTEGELRLAEARDGEAQPVAQRLEIVRRGRHGRAPGTSSALENAAVDRARGAEIGDAHALVQLVDRGVDRSELDHLAADVGDEAAVRRAAGAGQLGRDAGHLADRVARDVDELAARREIRLAESGPGERVVEAVPREDAPRSAAAAIRACWPARSGS